MKGNSYLAALLLGGAAACSSADPTESTSRGDTPSSEAGSDTQGSDSTGSSATGAGNTTGGLTTGGIDIDTSTPNDLSKTSKVDLLFAIDNSLSMGDKQRILAQTVPDLIGRMATPDCIDSSGGRVPSEVGGTCSNGGSLEFVPVTDIHIAVISS